MESKCEKGYEGPLCQTCKSLDNIYYSKKGENACQECYNPKTEIFIFVVVVIVFILFYAVLVK